jgi:AbiV family abortive infection protein
MEKRSEEDIAKDFEAVKKITVACLKNAEDLVKSAKTLLGQGVNHICYHLATLALEEIGKISILRMKFGAQSAGRAESFSTPGWDDHVKKLFWAVWAPMIGQTKVTKEQLDFCKGLATDIHNTRLNSLYVDPANPVLAGDKISDEELMHIVNLAESRVGLQASEGEHIFDEETAEIGSWFVDANDNPESRAFIFSTESMDKLVELQSPRKWIEWLYQRSMELEKQAKELLEQELNRPPVEGAEIWDKKWKVKIRLYSASHSIRQKVLNKWNEVSTHIFLSSAKKNDELFCEFSLVKGLSIKDLWGGLWESSRLFVIALNVGTRGFFWWYLPREVTSLYDEIIDLENNRNAKVEDTFKFKDNWHHLALKETDIAVIRHVMLYLVSIKGTDKEQPFIHYSVALSLLAKSDPQMNLYSNTFIEFYQSLVISLYVNQQWDGKEEVKIAARRGFISETEEITDLDRYLELGQAVVQGQRLEEITSKEVVQMKQFFDVYVLVQVQRVMQDTMDAVNALDNKFKS